MVDRPERAMVVTPHPDDAEIGCGGTIAGWIRQGTVVVYVLCTNGDKGTENREMTSARLAAIREEEQGAAAATLGVKEVVYLRHPDGGLEDSSEFREQLVRAIRTHRPDTVLCPDPFRQNFYLHRDHRICGQVTLDAVFPFARDHLHFQDHLQVDGLEPHKVGEMLMWGTEAPDNPSEAERLHRGKSRPGAMSGQPELEPSRTALYLAERSRTEKSPRGSGLAPAEIVAIGQLLIEIGDMPWRSDDRPLTEQASRGSRPARVLL